LGFRFAAVKPLIVWNARYATNSPDEERIALFRARQFAVVTGS
jgi:hypothetical protein